MKSLFSKWVKPKPETDDEMRARVIDVASHAYETLRHCHSFSHIDTSVFQEQHIYRCKRESLGWTAKDGWRRTPPELAELRSRLTDVTDPNEKKALLLEIGD